MQRLIRHGERRTFDTGVLREGGNCRSVLYALGVLLVCLLGSYLFLFRLEHVRVLQEREKARYVVDSYATKIQYVVANAFSSAYLVEALLRQGEGRISEFYSYAEELVKMHPSTININLAPRGVVTKVYPFERNKKAIGHDLFANPERSREALLARDSGKATIAGPFDLIQGGYAMAVRLPVFMGEPEGDITAQEKFWGLICVTFAFPDVLDPVKLEYLDKQNYVYQLSRIHPDTGDRIVLLRSAETLIEPVERKVHLPNADWILSVTPKGGWNWSIRYASFGIATFISILFSCVVGLAVDLAHQKKRLELMSSKLRCSPVDRPTLSPCCRVQKYLPYRSSVAASLMFQT
jgi:sensor domain CHASE-containing protein